MPKIKLFCFPYAGGSSSIYYDWKHRLSTSIELVPIELPGRGVRFSDAFHNTFDEMIGDILRQVLPHVSGAPYALFGHSMGALLAYEIHFALNRMKMPQPVHLFFSGCEPPHLKFYDNPIHHLPDQEFLAEIYEMGGTPKEFLEQKELQELFLPVLRSDFKIVESYRHNPDTSKIRCPASVLYGSHEDGIELMDRWQDLTEDGCDFLKFDGDHFFINNYPGDIVAYIHDTLVDAPVPMR